MALVLDAGALIAFDRGDRKVAALVEDMRRRGRPMATSSGCVAQAWRDGRRQAKLAGLLLGLTEVPLDESASRAVGTLCAVTRTADVVDAHLALIARNHDVLATSDPDDLRTLLSAAGCSAEIVLC